MLDLIFRNARLEGREAPVDIGVAAGRFVAVEAGLPEGAAEHDCAGRLATAGLVETHIHLDKSGLARACGCGGSLADAIAAVAAAKRGFTEEDVHARAARTLEKAILHGTTRMRTHLEVDPRVGLTSFRALQALKRDHAGAINLELCVFPQEGLTNDPGCEDLLVEALDGGADLIGGVPYTDTDPNAQLDRIFALARRFDVDVNLHLDFDLDPARSDLEAVCRLADRHGWGGRVAIGHVTKLSALPPAPFEAAARRLAGAGVALTVLPATDLYLTGRASTHLVPRGVTPAHRLAAAGVTCSLATNNVLNPFTPFGDCSLMRIANLYANVAQVGSVEDLAGVFDMVTGAAARLMRLPDYGVAVGNPADLVLFDAPAGADAVAEIAPPVAGWRRGRPSFVRPAARLLAQPGPNVNTT